MNPETIRAALRELGAMDLARMSFEELDALGIEDVADVPGLLPGEQAIIIARPE